MVGLNMKLSVISGCIKEEECKKPRKQALIRQQPFKKGHVSISKSCTHGAFAFGENVLQSLTRTTLADVNKIKASKCHSVPVLQCVCMIENVSSRTLLTRWRTEKVFFDIVLFWLISGASAENPVKNLKIWTQAVLSTDRSTLEYAGLHSLAWQKH